MLRRFTVEKVENGYVLYVVWADDQREQHIATTDAKLKKLIKAIMEVKQEEKTDAN